MNRHTPSALARYLCSTCLLLSLLASSAHAQNGMRKEDPGLSGNIKLMAGVVCTTPALGAVSDENRNIETLTQDAESETTFFPIVLWDLGYTFGNRRTALYAGTPDSNIVKGTFFLEVGRVAVPRNVASGGPAGGQTFADLFAGFDKQALKAISIYSPISVWHLIVT